MDYVERLARAKWPDFDDCIEGARLGRLSAAGGWLKAIAATGCKVVEREPTERMVDTYYRAGAARPIQDTWAAAPAYPGADDDQPS